MSNTGFHLQWTVVHKVQWTVTVVRCSINPDLLLHTLLTVNCTFIKPLPHNFLVIYLYIYYAMRLF